MLGKSRTYSLKRQSYETAYRAIRSGFGVSQFRHDEWFPAFVSHYQGIMHTFIGWRSYSRHCDFINMQVLKLTSSPTVNQLFHDVS